MILKCILKEEDGVVMNWIILPQDTGKWQAVVKTVMKIRDP